MKNNEYTNNHVKSVDKALSLTELLLSCRRPMSLQELSTLSGYPKSTAHALLATLWKHRMIEQQEDGKYYLGIKFYEYGRAVSTDLDILKIARPHLAQLSDQTGASAFLSLVEDSDIFILDHYPTQVSDPVLLTTGFPDIKFPLHATAQGKLLLAWTSDQDIQRRFLTQGMQAFTRHTITDPQRMCSELDTIRQNHYAYADNEHCVGLQAVAVPILNQQHQLKYAIGVAGSLPRLSTDELAKIIQQTNFHAHQISLILGYAE